MLCSLARFPSSVPLLCFPARFSCSLPLLCFPARYSCSLPLICFPARFSFSLPLLCSSSHFPFFVICSVSQLCSLLLPEPGSHAFSPALFPCSVLMLSPLPCFPARFSCSLPCPVSLLGSHALSCSVSLLSPPSPSPACFPLTPAPLPPLLHAFHPLQPRFPLSCMLSTHSSPASPSPACFPPTPAPLPPLLHAFHPLQPPYPLSCMLSTHSSPPSPSPACFPPTLAPLPPLLHVFHSLQPPFPLSCMLSTHSSPPSPSLACFPPTPAPVPPLLHAFHPLQPPFPLSKMLSTHSRPPSPSPKCFSTHSSPPSPSPKCFPPTPAPLPPLQNAFHPLQPPFPLSKMLFHPLQPPFSLSCMLSTHSSPPSPSPKCFPPTSAPLPPLQNAFPPTSALGQFSPFAMLSTASFAAFTFSWFMLVVSEALLAVQAAHRGHPPVRLNTTSAGRQVLSRAPSAASPTRSSSLCAIRVHLKETSLLPLGQPRVLHDRTTPGGGGGAAAAAAAAPEAEGAGGGGVVVGGRGCSGCVQGEQCSIHVWVTPPAHWFVPLASDESGRGINANNSSQGEANSSSNRRTSHNSTWLKNDLTLILEGPASGNGDVQCVDPPACSHFFISYRLWDVGDYSSPHSPHLYALRLRLCCCANNKWGVILASFCLSINGLHLLSLTLSHSPSLTHPISLTLSHSPSLTHPISLTLSHSPSLTHPLSLTLSHSPSLTHPLSLTLSHSPSLTHPLSLTLSHSPSLTHPLSLTLSLSPSLTHPLSLTLSHSPSLTHSLSLTLSHSPSLTRPLSLTLSTHPLSLTFKLTPFQTTFPTHPSTSATLAVGCSNLNFSRDFAAHFNSTFRHDLATWNLFIGWSEQSASGNVPAAASTPGAADMGVGGFDAMTSAITSSNTTVSDTISPSNLATPCTPGSIPGRWKKDSSGNYSWTFFPCAPPLSPPSHCISDLRRKGIREVNIVGDSRQRLLAGHMHFLQDYERPNHTLQSSNANKDTFKINFYWIDGIYCNGEFGCGSPCSILFLLLFTAQHPSQHHVPDHQLATADVRHPGGSDRGKNSNCTDTFPSVVSPTADVTMLNTGARSDRFYAEPIKAMRAHLPEFLNWGLQFTTQSGRPLVLRTAMPVPS
ncbi:unnamed protein product [Closterium sp. NIES-65]|nr:unnamed protein product [Closterium sp. NIES-65]